MGLKNEFVSGACAVCVCLKDASQVKSRVGKKSRGRQSWKYSYLGSAFLVFLSLKNRLLLFLLLKMLLLFQRRPFLSRSPFGAWVTGCHSMEFVAHNAGW